MSKEKSEKIPAVNYDPQVVAAQKKLTELEQQLEQAIYRPSQVIENDLTERAELLLSGKPAKPKVAPDEIEVLKRAVGIALANYQKAKAAAATKIIASITPLHDEKIKRLLDSAQKFSSDLLEQAQFIEQSWQSGLFDYLPATWSLKWRIVLTGKPGVGSRLDALISNLRLPT